MFGITIPDDLLLMGNFKSMDDVTQVVIEQLAEKTIKSRGNVRTKFDRMYIIPAEQ